MTTHRPKYWLLLLPVMLLALLAGCRTTRPGYSHVKLKEDNRTPEARFKAVTEGYTPWLTFAAKGRFTLSGDSAAVGASMQLRMARGQWVSISLRGAMGIEGGRIFITPDSLYIIDKMNKTYIADVLATFTGGIDITLSHLQELMIGRAFGNAQEAWLTEGIEQGYFAAAVAGDGGTSYSFIFDSHNLLTMMVASNKATLACSAMYGQHVDTPAGGIVPTVWTIIAQLQGSEVVMQAEYSPESIAWDSQVNERLKISPSYSRSSAQQLLQQLGSTL